jgi:hypothetical protein
MAYFGDAGLFLQDRLRLSGVGWKVIPVVQQPPAVGAPVQFAREHFVDDLRGDVHVAAAADFAVEWNDGGPGLFRGSNSLVPGKEWGFDLAEQGLPLRFELLAFLYGLAKLLVDEGTLCLDFLLFGVDPLLVFDQPGLGVVEFDHDGDDTLFLEGHLFLEHLDLVEERLVLFVFLDGEQLGFVLLDLRLLGVDVDFGLALFELEAFAHLFAFAEFGGEAFSVDFKLAFLFWDLGFARPQRFDFEVQILQLQ